MCEHGRGLDGRTVARGRHKRQAVQARLGRRRGGQTGKPTAQIEPKSRVIIIFSRPDSLHCVRCGLLLQTLHVAWSVCLCLCVGHTGKLRKNG